MSNVDDAGTTSQLSEFSIVGVRVVAEENDVGPVQGYLALKKTPTPLGLP